MNTTTCLLFILGVFFLGVYVGTSDRVGVAMAFILGAALVLYVVWRVAAERHREATGERNGGQSHD